MSAQADDAPRGFVPKSELYRALRKIDRLEEEIAFLKRRDRNVGMDAAGISESRPAKEAPRVGGSRAGVCASRILELLQNSDTPMRASAIAKACDTDIYNACATLSDLATRGFAERILIPGTKRRFTWVAAGKRAA